MLAYIIHLQCLFFQSQNLWKLVEKSFLGNMSIEILCNVLHNFFFSHTWQLDSNKTGILEETTYVCLTNVAFFILHKSN